MRQMPARSAAVVTRAAGDVIPGAPARERADGRGLRRRAHHRLGGRLGGLRGHRSDARPNLGPWLRDERVPYDGLVAAAVDRLGRNVVVCLNTGYKMRDEKKMLVTYGHEGAWDLDDSADENRFTMEAWGAQMELRAIQRRNRDATVRTRAAGRPKGKPSYGFQYVRKVMGGKIDHVELHPHVSEVIREVARRVLADPENNTCSSEAARLNRAGELSPADHLAVMYGKSAGGRPWSPQSLKDILGPWPRILNTGYAACASVVGVRWRAFSKAIGDRCPRRECRRRVL
ncbi:recombinase family protein [Streptomyces sp. EAG2]|uniref:recombinase family protein n=1 Tax=Streptomyces sp. EAG2 TaxID=2056495 RepID=UPI00295007C3|nr:recombinase family protein [Streptomyces sp. EAG2]